LERTSGREDLVTVLTGCWLITGAGLDGRAHVTQQLDTFFTPWHAVLYTGFGATVAWVMLITRKRMTPGRSWRSSIPDGYRLALVGLAMFFVGGVGDLLWHQAFGIERSIAAVFSPTHQLLFFGAILILTSPFRAAWARPQTVAPTRAIASITLALTITLLAMTYSSPFVFQDAYFSSLRNDPVYERAGLTAVLFTNLLMLAPAIALLVRWRLPFGTFMGLYGIPVAAVVIVNVPSRFPLILGVLIAAIAIDVLVAVLRATPQRPSAQRLVATVAPAFLWGAYFATVALDLTLGWEVELWAGAILWSSASGLAIAELLLATRRGWTHVSEPAAPSAASVMETQAREAGI
jgi:hypothetical protein